MDQLQILTGWRRFGLAVALGVALAPAAAPAGAVGGVSIAPWMLPYTITAPGHYRLTGNAVGVSNAPGITIAADDVVLDLNGFALQGVPGSGHGIAVVPSARRISVRNGSVSGWGGAGIHAVAVTNGCFEGLLLAGNAGNGLTAGFSVIVRDCRSCANGNIGMEAENSSLFVRCTAWSNAQHGLDAHSGALVTDCTVLANGHDGIHGSHGCIALRCCAGDSSASGDGVEVDTGSLVLACATHGSEDGVKIRTGGGLVGDSTAVANRDDGIDADAGSAALRCVVMANADEGVRVSGNCVAAGNLSLANGFVKTGSGVKVEGLSASAVDNHSVANRKGFDVGDVGSFISRNSAFGSTSASFDVAAGNSCQVVGFGAVPEPWVNLAWK